MTARIGVLALQGDVTEHVQALERCGALAIGIRDVSDLSAVDGLVIPGGESTTISLLIRSRHLEEPLRAFIADGMPVWGTCAGMILLATKILDGRSDQIALGGIDMTVRRNAFGRQINSYEENLDVVGVDGGPSHATFIRAPQVEEIGPDVHVLARALHPLTGPIVAVKHGDVLATSFHPELGGDDRIHRLFVSMVDKRLHP